MKIRDIIQQVKDVLPIEVAHEAVSLFDDNQKKVLEELSGTVIVLQKIIPLLQILEEIEVSINIYFERSKSQQNLLQIELLEGKRISIYFSYVWLEQNVKPKTINDVLIYFKNEILRVKEMIEVLETDINVEEEQNEKKPNRKH